MQTSYKDAGVIYLPGDEGRLNIEVKEETKIPINNMTNLLLNDVTFRHEDHHGVTLTRLPRQTVVYCQHCGLRLVTKVTKMESIAAFRDAFRCGR